jgi:hypothetical protein
MIIPPLQGKLEHTDFFIYGACDEKYFDEFGRVLIKSIRQNSNNDIHLHLFNPRADQLDFCQQHSVSVSYEVVPKELFQIAADKWQGTMTTEFDIERQKRTLKSMEKGGDKSILERMQKTYFACARFIRLAELLKDPQKVFSIDVDAVVRKQIPALADGPDLYIRRNKQFLAGGVYLTGNKSSYKFIKEYSTLLTSNINADKIYWSLDQDVLDVIAGRYRYGELPMSYIDWFMDVNSYIWTAKGKRKDLKIFIDEQSRYLT